MNRNDVFKAWGKNLPGNCPSLSIEITRECALRCPGCYEYEPGHLAEDVGLLRTLNDFKGDDLIENVLDLVRKYKPLHLLIVGGEPLVKFRELQILLPQLSEMGVAVQLVTSAVKEIPKAWAKIKGLYVVVSIDGLQPEHDARRNPATYERILRNIKGHQITVHCRITSQTVNREGYYDEFLVFWSARPEVRQIWFSLFPQQIGAENEEILAPEVRAKPLNELVSLRSNHPKLVLSDLVVNGYKKPLQSPDECIFSLTTLNMTADLKNLVTPCQFGGTPDCSQCGCIASAGLAAVGDYKLFNIIPLRKIFTVSHKIGKTYQKLTRNKDAKLPEISETVIK